MFQGIFHIFFVAYMKQQNCYQICFLSALQCSLFFNSLVSFPSVDSFLWSDPLCLPPSLSTGVIPFHLKSVGQPVSHLAVWLFTGGKVGANWAEVSPWGMERWLARLVKVNKGEEEENSPISHLLSYWLWAQTVYTLDLGYLPYRFWPRFSTGFLHDKNTN